jgi:hypothetical protein
VKHVSTPPARSEPTSASAPFMLPDLESQR